jgi:predicted lipid-binding transport protein (Tim44 family)
MRSRWEAGAAEDTQLDEPVTITQRQLRSLTRGARAGLFGVLLAMVAIGLAAWSMFGGPRSSAAHEPGPAVSPAEATQGVPAENTAASAPAKAPAQTAAVTPKPTVAQTKPATRVAEATPAKVSSRKRTATKAVKAEEIRTPISVPVPVITPDTTR